MENREMILFSSFQIFGLLSAGDREKRALNALVASLHRCQTRLMPGKRYKQLSVYFGIKLFEIDAQCVEYFNSRNALLLKFSFLGHLHIAELLAFSCLTEQIFDFVISIGNLNSSPQPTVLRCANR